MRNASLVRTGAVAAALLTLGVAVSACAPDEKVTRTTTTTQESTAIVPPPPPAPVSSTTTTTTTRQINP